MSRARIFTTELMAVMRTGLRVPNGDPLERAELALRELPDVAAGLAHEERMRLEAEARAEAAEREAEQQRQRAASLLSSLTVANTATTPFHESHSRFAYTEDGVKSARHQEEIAAAAIRIRERQLDLDRRAIDIEVARVGIEQAKAEVEVTRAGVKTPKSDADLTKAEFEKIRNEASIRRVEASELYALYRDFIAKRDENAEIIGEEAAQEIFRQSRRSLGLDDDSPFGGDPRRGGRR